MTTFDRAMVQTHMEDCRTMQLLDNRHRREMWALKRRHAWLSLLWYGLGFACGAAGVWWAR